MIRLQRCVVCGAAQYPRREFCGACLSDALAWEEAESLPARVLACTRLHHSHEPRVRPLLPLTLGLVRFDAGPVAVCFLGEDATPGDAVRVRFGAGGLLEAFQSDRNLSPTPPPGPLPQGEGESPTSFPSPRGRS